MRFVLMPCIVLFSVAPGFVHAEEEPLATTSFIPEMETLPAEDLKVLLEEWDVAFKSDEFRKIELWKIYLKVDDDMYSSGEFVLRYNNPEIVDRVVELYLRECGKSDAPFPGSDSATNPWHAGEGGAEYVTALSSIAQSTFDPRIFSAVFDDIGGYGGLRRLYLATVDPKDTLRYLLESNRGEWIGGPRPGHRDYFYHGSHAWGMSVDGAFELMSLMATQSPDVLHKHRAQVLEFVKTHIDNFRNPRPVSYKDELVYMRHHDYWVRDGALDILELLGTPQDVELANAIMRDLPEMGSIRLGDNPTDRRDLIRAKGIRILKKIRQRATIKN